MAEELKQNILLVGSIPAGVLDRDSVESIYASHESYVKCHPMGRLAWLVYFDKPVSECHGVPRTTHRREINGRSVVFIAKPLSDQPFIRLEEKEDRGADKPTIQLQ